MFANPNLIPRCICVVFYSSFVCMSAYANVLFTIPHAIVVTEHHVPFGHTPSYVTTSG